MLAPIGTGSVHWGPTTGSLLCHCVQPSSLHLAGPEMSVKKMGAAHGVLLDLTLLHLQVSTINNTMIWVVERQAPAQSLYLGFCSIDSDPVGAGVGDLVFLLRKVILKRLDTVLHGLWPMCVSQDSHSSLG